MCRNNIIRQRAYLQKLSVSALWKSPDSEIKPHMRVGYIQYIFQHSMTLEHGVVHHIIAAVTWLKITRKSPTLDHAALLHVMTRKLIVACVLFLCNDCFPGVHLVMSL